MKERCPHCKLLGKAVLHGWQIAFKRYITLDPCENGEVPVGVWQFDEDGLKELDKIESYPTVYRREIVEIDFEWKKIEALLYVINDTHPKYPDRPYLNNLMIGYRDFNFDPHYIYDAIDRLPLTMNMV